MLHESEEKLQSQIDELKNQLESLANQSSTNESAGEDELLTVKEVAKLLRVAPQTIYNRVHSGTIPYIKADHSSRVYFRKSDLEKTFHIVSPKQTAYQALTGTVPTFGLPSDTLNAPNN